jgi:hypothetical protein
MGVSLSLEGTRQARTRRRGGQHSRTMEEQACLDALAALLRSDAPGASRCLSRVSRVGLASRLVPAAQALARAADLELASDTSAICGGEPDFVLSPACLLGRCDGVAGTSVCRSPACQHECHTRAGPVKTDTLLAAPVANTVLTDAVLTDAVLADAVLADAVLADAVLADAEVADTVDTDTALTDAEVAGTAVTDAVVTDAVLPDAELADTVVTDAVLTDAEVADSVLTDAVLTDAEVAEAS